MLRKWKASEASVLDKVPDHLKDEETDQEIVEDEQFTKVLGMEWNSNIDAIRPLICSIPSDKPLTKRNLLSENA